MAHPEALLISAVLRTGTWNDVAEQHVDPSMFTVHPNEFTWIERYVERHGRVPSKVAFQGKFPDFTVYKADDTAQFCEDVRESYAQYRLTVMMDTAVDLMVDGQVDRAINALSSELLSIQASVAPDPGDYSVVDDWESTYDDISKRITRVRIMGRAGIPTGFPTLDMNSGGMQPGWLCVVGGRLGMGKTWTMVRMACEAAYSGYKAHYFSLEQSRHQIAMRMHSFISARYQKNIFRSLDLMRGSGFDVRDYKTFLEQLEDMLPGALVINDTSRGRVSPLSVASAIERTQPDIVFVDYLTLMEAKGDGGWRSIAGLSSDLKQVAERYGIPVVAGSQINRLGIGKEPPDAGTIAQADAVGQDADMVLTIVQKSKHVMKSNLVKFRHGPDGVIWYSRFDPNSGIYDEIDGDSAAKIIQTDQEAD